MLGTVQFGLDYGIAKARRPDYRVCRNIVACALESGINCFNYTLERLKPLNLYLEHGTLEIDNNLVENAIRPTAIGKKNFLFFGSPESGQTSVVSSTASLKPAESSTSIRPTTAKPSTPFQR